MYSVENEKPKVQDQPEINGALAEVRSQYGVSYEPKKEDGSLTSNEVEQAITEIQNRILSNYRLKQAAEEGSNEYIQCIYKEVGLTQAMDIILKYR